MKKLCIILFCIVSQLGFAQSQFEVGMTKANQLAEENKLEEACNLYERIAKVEPENWLPAYHYALLKVVQTLTSTDKVNVEAQLKLAGEYAGIADMLSPNNSEVYVLKAMVNIGWIVYDPATYGMSLSEKTNELYRKAIELDEKNPRAYSGLIEMEMGTARFFNQDLTELCKKLKKTIPLYDDFVPAGKFYPNWGKDNVERNIEACK